jgi:hypothetical protein
VFGDGGSQTTLDCSMSPLKSKPLSHTHRGSGTPTTPTRSTRPTRWCVRRRVRTTPVASGPGCRSGRTRLVGPTTASPGPSAYPGDTDDHHEALTVTECRARLLWLCVRVCPQWVSVILMVGPLVLCVCVMALFSSSGWTDRLRQDWGNCGGMIFKVRP